MIFIEPDQLEGFSVSNSTELAIGTASDGQTAFSSTAFGTGKDNPSDAFDLTEVQANRGLSFQFRARSCFNLSLAVLPPGASRGMCQGRSCRSVRYSSCACLCSHALRRRRQQGS